MKQRIGYIESLENRVGELADRYDGIKLNKVLSRIEGIEKRLAQLEKWYIKVLILAYCIVSVSVFKIIVDIVNPELFANFSVILDIILCSFVFALILNTLIKIKSGKRESLKSTMERLEKNINEHTE